jgi:hypothetical protein
MVEPVTGVPNTSLIVSDLRNLINTDWLQSPDNSRYLRRDEKVVSRDPWQVGTACEAIFGVLEDL